MDEKQDRLALRSFLDKLVQYGQQKVKEAKQAKPPAEKPNRAPLPRKMADLARRVCPLPVSNALAILLW